MVKES
jgi:hypothetical protein